MLVYLIVEVRQTLEPMNTIRHSIHHSMSTIMHRVIQAPEIPTSAIPSKTAARKAPKPVKKIVVAKTPRYTPDKIDLSKPIPVLALKGELGDLSLGLVANLVAREPLKGVSSEDLGLFVFNKSATLIFC